MAATAVQNYFGLYLDDRTDGGIIEGCTVAYNNAPVGWYPTNDLTSSQRIQIGATARFRYHAHGGADDCQIDHQSAPLDDTLPLDPAAYVPGLAPGLGARFLWIDVVSR